jgi:hypothetical protein
MDIAETKPGRDFWVFVLGTFKIPPIPPKRKGGKKEKKKKKNENREKGKGHRLDRFWRRQI